MGKKVKKTYDEILMSEEFWTLMTGNDEKSNLYWKQLIEDDRAFRKEFEKATTLHEILTNHKKVKYPDDTKNECVDRLINLINAGDRELNTKRSGHSIYNILKIAATVIILTGLYWILTTRLDVFNNIGRNIYHEIIVPSGEKSQVHLSDGTRIWLNSESKLRYQANYKKTERRVFLEGEAYFDVSEQKGSHFTVFTQQIKVEALGTIFNIKSYPDDPTIETTLVEGIIKIGHSGKKNKFSQITLQPNEKFIYNKATEAPASPVTEKKEEKHVKPGIQQIEPLPKITVSKVNTENITCWKDYLLVFDNETLEEIAVKMSRWYKLKVNILDDELKKQRYTGKFVNNETIYQVLEAINLTTPIEHTVVDDQVNIYRKDSKKVNKKYRGKL